MATKEIKCTVCRKSMGEIRDATLRKGIRYICEPCDNRRLDLMVEMLKIKGGPKSEFDKMFGKGGLFGGF